MAIWLDDLRSFVPYQDGLPISDGARVRAVDFRGQILSYNPVTGTLTVGADSTTERAEVHAATTAALATYTFASNSLTKSSNGALGAIDGVTLTTGQRLLVKDEGGANVKYNGWYVVSDPGSASTPWILTRATDSDSASELQAGATSRVLSGLVNGGKTFVLTTTVVTLNTDGISFIEYFPTSAAYKDPVRAATTAALAANTLSSNILTATANGALAAIDGVTLVLNDRVLVKDEGTGSKNGIYRVSDLGSGGTPWTLTRAADLQYAAQAISGIRVTVTEGTVNDNKDFVLTTNNPITLNTTSLTFSTLTVAAPGTTLQLLYNNGGAIDSASGITVVGSEAALAFGANPAASGFVRTPNSNTPILAGRNSGNTADIAAIAVATDNAVYVGDSADATAVYLQTAGSVSFRPGGATIDEYIFGNTSANFTNNALLFGTNPATTGTIRLANNMTGIVARNAANNGDITMMSCLSDNAVRVGNTTNAAAVYLLSAGGIGEEMPSGGVHTITINSTVEYSLSASTFDCNQNSITDASFIALGSGTVASQGLVRVPHGAGQIVIDARNQADSADGTIITWGIGGNNWLIYGSTQAAICIYNVTSGGTHTWWVNDVTEMTLSASGLDIADNALTNVGDFDHDGTNLGFYGTTPIAKRTITGSRGGNAALADLLTDLAAYGLITDSTSA